MNLIRMNRKTDEFSGLLKTAATENGIKIKDGREEDYAWLAETEPDNLYMRLGNYTGPSIQV